MLAFYTQPSDKLVSPAPAGSPNIRIEEHSRISMYFHGQLQTDLKFDIAHLHDGTLKLPNETQPTRSEACLTWNHNTQTWVPSTIRMWLTQRKDRIIGLITSPGDPEEQNVINKQTQRNNSV